MIMGIMVMVSSEIEQSSETVQDTYQKDVVIEDLGVMQVKITME